MQEWGEEIIELQPLPGCGRAVKAVLDKATDVFNAIYEACFPSEVTMSMVGFGYYLIRSFTYIIKKDIINALSYQEYSEKGVEFAKCFTFLQPLNCQPPINVVRDFASTINVKSFLNLFWCLYDDAQLFYFLVVLLYLDYTIQEQKKIHYQLHQDEKDDPDLYLAKLMELGLDKERDLMDLSMEFLDQVLAGDIDEICFIPKTGMLADLSTVKKFKKCPVTNVDIDPEKDLLHVYQMDNLKSDIEKLFTSLEDLIEEGTLKKEHDADVSSIEMILLEDDVKLPRHRGGISFFKRIKDHGPEIFAVIVAGGYIAFDLIFRYMHRTNVESEVNKCVIRQGILKGQCDIPAINELACQSTKVNVPEEAGLLKTLDRYNGAKWFYNLFLYSDYMPITPLFVFLVARKFFVEMFYRDESLAFWQEDEMLRSNLNKNSLYNDVSSAHADNGNPHLNILHCPITRDRIINPVLVLASGQIFEKSAIETWVNNQSEEAMSCPVTHVKINDKKEIVPILNLRYFHEALEAKLKSVQSELLDTASLRTLETFHS